MTAIVRSFVIAPALNGAFFAVAAARRMDVVTLRVPGASVCIH